MYGIRKYCGFLALIVLVALMIGACGSKGVSKGDVPDWYLNPPKSADRIYGVGASEQMASIQLAKQAADNLARAAIGNVVQSDIATMMRNYLQQSGTMEAARALQFTESVTKVVSNVSLSGAVISKSEIINKRCFSLAEISKDSINQALLNAVRDAAAEYTELKAQKAFDDLNNEIKSGNITK
ncbi:hypothetical protein LLG96_17565 [bacterium]|nr:hypothetical protein [bacterium]